MNDPLFQRMFEPSSPWERNRRSPDRKRTRRIPTSVDIIMRPPTVTKKEEEQPASRVDLTMEDSSDTDTVTAPVAVTDAESQTSSSGDLSTMNRTPPPADRPRTVFGFRIRFVSRRPTTTAVTETSRRRSRIEDDLRIDMNPSVFTPQGNREDRRQRAARRRHPRDTLNRRRSPPEDVWSTMHREISRLDSDGESLDFCVPFGEESGDEQEDHESSDSEADMMSAFLNFEQDVTYQNKISKKKSQALLQIIEKVNEETFEHTCLICQAAEARIMPLPCRCKVVCSGCIRDDRFVAYQDRCIHCQSEIESFEKL